MQVFFRNCPQILTRTQGKKFEDMFLVKIASQGTSLKCKINRCFLLLCLLEPLTQSNLDANFVGKL